MNTEEQQVLMRLLLGIGERLLSCGAETHRVEDTLDRVGRAAGATYMNVMVITAGITITAGFGENEMLTHTRRIRHDATTDFHALEAVNTASRRFCSGEMTIAEFEELLLELKKPKEKLTMYLGSAVATLGFCAFFGGSFADCAVCAVIGLLVCAFKLYASGLFPNRVLYNLTVAFLSGLVVCLTAKLVSGLDASKIMIGDIMLLTPGVAITGALRDVLVGDTISGTIRLVECVIWAGALAFGFMAAMAVTGI